MVDYDGVTRTYNAANQMTHDGTNALTYDNNGNLRTVGSDTYTWDRANRLLSVGNHSYVYDGLGNRVQQTVSSVVTDYLNDVQPGLTKLLKQDDGTNVDRFVHGVRGIHTVDDGVNWNFYAQDGLGSVRAVVDDMAVVQSSMSFDPYGDPIGAYGAGFGYTGEQTDGNGQVYLRARYYNPSMGIFSALDPDEGMACTPMSLNGYGYVHGNPIMNTDPTGMTCECDQYISPWNFQSYIDCLANPANHHDIVPSPTPEPTVTSCGMRDQNGVNALAATAIAETDGGGALSQNNVAVAALMLMQVNSFRTGSWRQLGTFAGQNATPLTIVADQTQTRIIDIAALMVSGYCQNANPLSQFNANNYPSIANSNELVTIAGNSDARFEISIDASRAEQFANDPAYPLQFILTAPDADRAIVIGGANITNAWLRYQCPNGQVEVMRENPSNMSTPFTANDAEGEKFTCESCRLSHYWWLNSSTGVYERITTEELLSNSRVGFGATCG